ncbi:MAG: hypothetical protein REH79_01375, partial [Spiroplasma sp.]|nr:hypothetical protein [Spiroplasma sp.]
KLEDQYNKLEKNKKEVEDRFYNLNIKNKMLGQKLIILVDEKRKLEDQYNKLEKNKKEVEEQLTKKENEYNKLEDEKNELQEKYDELETEKTKINNELTKNQEKYKQLEIKHNKLEDEKNELQYQYEELETEKAKINNELTKNQEKYKQLEIKHNKLEDEKNELQEKYNELQKEKETLEKEYQILQENYDLSQTKITELQKNITYLAKEKKEINDKFYEKNKKYNYLKNKQEKLEISMIQYYFDTWSLNNPFDLKNTINIDNTWYDVLIKMKEHMITYVPGVSEEIFNLNEWAGENESSLDIKLKNDGVKNINHSKIFLFDNFTFNLHFKNIDTKKTITEAFYEIEKYLQTWTKENPFDLRNEVTFENTFMDIIEVIRKRLYSEEGINEEIIYHIRWIIPSEVVGKKLKDINWKFQSIGINNPDNNESREIDIAFKNIYTKGKHVEDYWKIKNYLDKWGLMSKFDLRYRISAFDDTLLDLTKEIERRLVAEENFDKKLIKNIEWRGKSGSSIRQKIIRNEGEDGRYQNLQFRYLPFFDKWSDNIPVYFDNFTSKR